MGSDVDSLKSLFNDVKTDYESLKILLPRLNENVARLNYNSGMLNQYEDFDDLDIFSIYKIQTMIRNMVLNLGQIEYCMNTYKTSLDVVEQEQERLEENKENV